MLDSVALTVPFLFKVHRTCGAVLILLRRDHRGDLQIEQVLVNLAINAQQAMAGQRGELVVRTRAGDGQVSIEVQDSGPGIPPEVQSRIFEPFFTTKAAGQGTGLGLSVSYGIIESHGGRISGILRIASVGDIQDFEVR